MAGQDSDGLIDQVERFLVAELPNLKTIAFNGRTAPHRTAARLGMKALGHYAQRYRIVLLPSRKLLVSVFIFGAGSGKMAVLLLR